MIKMSGERAQPAISGDCPERGDQSTSSVRRISACFQAFRVLFISLSDECDRAVVVAVIAVRMV
jgi:hypothetical protein